MSSLVATLGGGILLELLVFSALYRWTRLAGKQAALIVASIAIALYFPFGVSRWRGLDQFAIHLAFYAVIPYVLGIITSHWEIRARIEGETPDRRWFHWGPAMLVLFFVLLAGVDSIILTLAEKGLSDQWMERILPPPRSRARAISVFPGSVSHDFQEKEARFNAYLRQRQAQRALGWRVSKGWLGEPLAGRPVEFRIRVFDRHGKPVTGATVSGVFLRPSDSRKDVEFTLNEHGGGDYQAPVTLPQPGRWRMVATIRKGEALYEIRAETRMEPTIGDEAASRHTSRVQ